MIDSISTKTVWVRLCAMAKVPTDKTVGFRVNGQRMVLARCGDNTQVFQGFCSHQQYPLAGSKIADCVLTCNLHRSKFNAEDGTVVAWASLLAVSGKALADMHDQHALKSYRTRIENGDVYLEWPGDTVDAIRIKLDF